MTAGCGAAKSNGPLVASHATDEPHHGPQPHWHRLHLGRLDVHLRPDELAEANSGAVDALSRVHLETQRATTTLGKDHADKFTEVAEHKPAAASGT